MLDNFLGPDGNLVGRQAGSGQTWLTTFDSYPSLLVRSHRVIGAVGDELGAQIDSAFSAPQFAADWWCRLLLSLPVGFQGSSAVGCWFGSDSSGVYCGVVVQPNDSSHVQIAGGNLGPLDFAATAVPWVLGSTHEVVFQWFESGGRVSLIVDDAVVLTASGYTLDPATVLDFVLAELTDAGGLPSPILSVELATGVYS